MKTATERLLAFSFANADILLEVDAAHRVRYVCGAVQSLLDRPEENVRGISFEDLIGPADRIMVGQLLRALPNNARLNPVIVHLTADRDEPVTALLGGYRMDSEMPRFYLTLARARIGAVGSQEESHDAESGLLDRNSFTWSLQSKLAAARERNIDSKLTLIRLDDFGGFKSRVGGGAMARMMEEIGGLLRAMSVDGSTAGRLGDDRFGIMHMPSVDPAQIEKSVAEISRENDPTSAGLAVSGASVALGGDELSDEDQRRVILYTVRKFSDSGEAPMLGSLADGMKDLLADTVKRIHDFKLTLSDDRLRIALQPIVSLADRSIHHYEALARPTNGQPPAGLVGFAEEIGMTQDFDLLVCHKTIEILSHARESGISVAIAVNLSANSLESQIFIKTFRALIAENKWVAPQFLIEVTESMRIKDLVSINGILKTLRADGHKVCLDDFGAGASSFPYIQALDVDFVKIDGAYVKRLETHSRDRAILKAMVGLCVDLGIGTVAEMVENEVQAKTLADLGVEHAQGFLFGKPALDFAFPPPAPTVARVFEPPPELKPQMALRRRGAVESWGR